MSFLWDKEPGSFAGEIANRAMIFATARDSVEHILASAPELIRVVEPHRAPIAEVVDSVEPQAAPQSQPEQQPAPYPTPDTPEARLEEARRRAIQEAQPASSVNVYPEEFMTQYKDVA